jgi:hypothetical protein
MASSLRLRRKTAFLGAWSHFPERVGRHVTIVFHPRYVGADREVLESAMGREDSSGRIFTSVPIPGQAGLSSNVLTQRLFRISATSVPIISVSVFPLSRRKCNN